jgi:uncharacterized protein YdaU (DUF1376 family)
MNYYPFHIGDFRSGTVNMSRHTRWIYRDLLDIYYDTEQPLSLDLDLLCDQMGAESDDERRIVERLLRFKFAKTDDGYRHAICDQVIAEYRTKAETAKTNGKKGGRPKKPTAIEQKPSGFPSGSDQVADGSQQATGSEANQEPITNNQINTPKPPDGGLPPPVEPPIDPPPPERKPGAVELKTFIDACTAKGERPLRDYEPLWRYAQGAGLSQDFVALAWVEFCRRFLPGGTSEAKRYKDWRATFRKYVEGNYLKLWAIDANGEYFLTTLGKQAQKIHESKEAG